jgi:hypothetical protein
VQGVLVVVGIAVTLVTSQSVSLIFAGRFVVVATAPTETRLPMGATILRLHHELAVAEILYDAGMVTVTIAFPMAIWLTAALKTVLHMEYPAEYASARAVKYTPCAAVLSVPIWR